MNFRYPLGLTFLMGFFVQSIFTSISEEDKISIFQLGQLAQACLEKHSFQVNQNLLGWIALKPDLCLEHEQGLKISVFLSSLLSNLIESRNKHERIPELFLWKIQEFLEVYCGFVENFSFELEDRLVLWIRVLDRAVQFVIEEDFFVSGDFYNFLESFMCES